MEHKLHLWRSEPLCFLCLLGRIVGWPSRQQRDHRVRPLPLHEAAIHQGRAAAAEHLDDVRASHGAGLLDDHHRKLPVERQDRSIDGHGTS